MYQTSLPSAQARTRYEENVFPGNHTSVFGSWWQDGQWGFACCHQTTRNSYCTGEAGLRADARAEQRLADNLEARARQIEGAQEATTSAPAAAKVGLALTWGPGFLSHAGVMVCTVPGGEFPAGGLAPAAAKMFLPEQQTRAGSLTRWECSKH